MLKDDIELLSGRIITGSPTPALFLLLKDSPDMDKLCNDLKIERRSVHDNTLRNTSEPCAHALGGLSLEDWLANTAKPISL